MYPASSSSTPRCEYWWDDQVKFGLSVVTPAAAEPASVADVKPNSRIDSSDEDQWIAHRIQSARELCETFCKRRFVNTTLRLSLDQFPSLFYLPSPPLAEVVSLKYLDTGGVQQTLDPASYTVDTYSEPGRIVAAYGASWPSHRIDTNSIEVIYVAGYGTPADVPGAVRDAIVMTVSHWYENREAAAAGTVAELPWHAKSLLGTLRWGYLP